MGRLRRVGVPLLIAAAAALVAVPASGSRSGGRAWRAERVTDPPPGPSCCGDGSSHEHAHEHPHGDGAHHHHPHDHPHRTGPGHHHPY